MQYLFHRLFQFHHLFRAKFEHGLLKYKITANEILFCTVIIRRDTVCKTFLNCAKKTDIFLFLRFALTEERFILAFFILIIFILYEKFMHQYYSSNYDKCKVREWCKRLPEHVIM